MYLISPSGFRIGKRNTNTKQKQYKATEIENYIKIEVLCVYVSNV